MNFDLKPLPERTAKPREAGITMVMDKGLSLPEAESFLSMAESFTDIIKLGFGTSYVSPGLEDKIKLYKDAGIPIYLGGTLFEWFAVRNRFDDYRKVLDQLKLDYVEVSDGSFMLPHEKKCEYISELAKDRTVLSEVGSKDVEKIIPPYKWIELMNKELEAGAWKVIAEARESGTVGIYRGTGEVRSGLIQEILTQISEEKIIWEAPQKQQQVWFIKLLNANVNLGNIAPSEVLSVETIRLGLRGDTFEFFLDK